MCGPYLQQQLCEGISSGFLPDELPVYPVLNGSLINPVPLKYFKQFPEHVATGFVYLSSNTLSSTVSSKALIFPASGSEAGTSQNPSSQVTANCNGINDPVLSPLYSLVLK